MNASPTTSNSNSRGRKGLIVMILVVVGIGGVLAYVRSGKPQRDFIRENMAAVSIMDSVKVNLGTPIELGESSIVREGNKLTVKTPASGPDGEGVLVLVGIWDDSIWSRDDMHLEIDGKKVEVQSLDDILELEFDDGS